MAKEICVECYDCYYYWQNNDDISLCVGNEFICHEFVDINKVGEQNERT